MRRKSKILAAVLSLAMLAALLPSAAGFAASGTVNFHEAGVLTGGDGRPYCFTKPHSGTVDIYYWDYDGNCYEHKGIFQDDETPRCSYKVRTQDGRELRVYCVEHGVRVDTSKDLSQLSTSQIEKLVYAGLDEEGKTNLNLVLFYGYQDGRRSGSAAIDMLKKPVSEGGFGFGASSYFHAETNYNWQDWYVATQMLIWEIKQLNRTADMKRVTNGLGVSGDHYYSVVKGRPAGDIYNWMVTAIKNHKKWPNGISNNRNITAAKALEVALTEQEDGTWTYTFPDTTGTGAAYAVLTNSGKKVDKATVSYDKAEGKYTITFTEKPNSEGYRIVHAFGGEVPKDDLAVWGWHSGSVTHVQSVATGAADTERRYVKFLVDSTPPQTEEEIPGNPIPPDPAFFPTFSLSFEKRDQNGGWDGDPHTGMGDASLAATYHIYRKITDTYGAAQSATPWQEIGTVTLSEFGTVETFTDQPWHSAGDLAAFQDVYMKTCSTVDPGEPPRPHTDELRDYLEWKVDVAYKVVEERPDGRFIGPDTGVRSGYTASYTCRTTNSQTACKEEENWSEMTYDFRYQYRSTNETHQGLYGEDGIDATGVFDFNRADGADIFINDNDRGRLSLTKSNERADVFDEEDSSTTIFSSLSKWKMYLQSGGWEGHPYLSFVRESSWPDGTAVYKVVRDTSGEDNAAVAMDIGTNGCLYIYDIPYGTYTLEEVAADDTSLVLEQTTVFIGECDAEHGGQHMGGDPDVTPGEPAETYRPDDSLAYDNKVNLSMDDRRKRNVIKVIKTDAETGKQVDLTGTRFYIRYMGDPLLDDPKEAENYGRLLPNAASIDGQSSANRDYTFSCDENGEITIPYELPFGIYRLEEWLLPAGYFVGAYDESGQGRSHSFEELEEGQTRLLMESPDSWDRLVTVYDEKGRPVRYQDADSYAVDQMEGMIFNYYTFRVEKQHEPGGDGAHDDGLTWQSSDPDGLTTEATGSRQGYATYYQAVAMTNHPVKGRIEVQKTGEVLSGFKQEMRDGFAVSVPQFRMDALAGAVFGIFAAQAIQVPDGNDGPEIYDTDTGEKIIIPTLLSTHSGDNTLTDTQERMATLRSEAALQAVESHIYDEGTLDHPSGARLYFKRMRDKAPSNHYTRVYTTPEQKPSTYRFTHEAADADLGLRYRYDVDVRMDYKAGGRNVTDVRITKTTSVADGYTPDLDSLLGVVTRPAATVGTQAVDPLENFVSEESGDFNARGNVLNVWKREDVYEADGAVAYDITGQETDLSAIGARRYLMEVFTPYALTEADLARESRQMDASNDIDGDGAYDKVGEYEAHTDVERTKFEWDRHDGTVGGAADKSFVLKDRDSLHPGDQAVCAYYDVADETTKYRIYVTSQFAKPQGSFRWVDCDAHGVPLVPWRPLPAGYTEIERTPADVGPDVDDPRDVYVMAEREEADGSKRYMVYVELTDAEGNGLGVYAWVDCTADGNFEKMLVQEYRVTYTQESDSSEGFQLFWDGIEVASAADPGAGEATTTITCPFAGVTPEISLGIGYTRTEAGNTCIFTAKEPYAPVYFLHGDGIRTEMYYFGGLTRLTLTIPLSAADSGYRHVVPTLTYGTGENAAILDWLSPLSPDHPRWVYEGEVQGNTTITSERHERAAAAEPGDAVYYTLTIVSDQTLPTGLESGDAAVPTPISITYADGYTATVYRAESAAGNGIGVMVLDGIDKTSWYALSDLVETITTDETGIARSGNLPLGKYIVRELSAPNGFFCDTGTGREVELTYRDQFTPLVWETMRASNEHFRVEIDLSKTFETAYESGSFTPGSGAVFGLYNADDIPYSYYAETAEGKALRRGVLPKDTLLDAIATGEDGRAISRSKIPAGLYYLRELRTRPTHVLNQTPFYLYVGDGDFSKPLLISEDADGRDHDGMTVKAFMDGHGRATITVETLTRYPAARLNINDRWYALDERIEDEDCSNAVYPDRSVTRITARSGKPLRITLPDDRILTFSVADNRYTWSYDGGEEESYTADIRYTGYHAAYTLDGAQEDIDRTKEKPRERALVISGAEAQTAVTVTEVYEPRMMEEAVQMRDADGNLLWTHYVWAELTRGTLREAIAGGERIPEPPSRIRLDEGETLRLSTEEGQTYFLSMDADGDLTASVYGFLEAALSEENQPQVTLDGILQTADDGYQLYKSITTARQDAGADTVQVKVHTLDNVNSSAILNLHEKPNPPGMPPVEPLPDVPTLHTTATDYVNGTHTAEAVDGQFFLLDTVYYSGLTVGKTYLFQGRLLYRDTGEPLQKDGAALTVELLYTPQTSAGYVEMRFTFPAEGLSSLDLVVFERVYPLLDTDQDGIPDTPAVRPAAVHEVLDDEGQTVHLPEREEIVEIPPDDVPRSDHPAPENPKTGDGHRPGVYAVLLLASLAGLLATLLRFFSLTKPCEEGSMVTESSRKSSRKRKE